MRVRYPFLCVCLAFAMCFVTVDSFSSLTAAELWNSQKKGATEGKKTYYYNLKVKPTDDKTIKLYNGKTKTKSTTRNVSGANLTSVLKGYSNIKVSGQRASKAWGFLSANAAANREADINSALKFEYKQRKETAKTMSKMLNKVRKANIKADKKYANKLAEYQKKKDDEKRAKKLKKQRALNGGKLPKGKAYSLNRSSKSSKSVKTSSSSRPKEKRIQTKKPQRIFNSPN